MMNALKMKMETRKAKREIAKRQRKEIKQETENLLRYCKGYAESGYYATKGTNHYKTLSLRNAVANNLRQKGFKVETMNYPGSYAITSISWAK